jgi:zinc/manganese transport system substrate-binding protein
MKFKYLVLFTLITVFIAPCIYAQINIVTSTPDLKSITDAIGGDKVNTTSIARGNQNIHFVEILPSFMLKIQKAKMYIKIGMGLDQWADPLIDGSRNPDLLIVDCSKNIDKLEVPDFKADASYGDVHPYGNPHYWLDPANGKIIAKTIWDNLVKLSPKDENYFGERLAAFNSLLDKKIAEWKQLTEPYKGTKLIVFHSDWIYFAKSFGFELAGFIEPKPGLEPTASHLYDLIKLINDQHIRIIGYQPYFSDESPNSLASQTGAKALRLASSVGCVKGIYTYFDIFDYNVKQITDVLKEVK